MQSSSAPKIFVVDKDPQYLRSYEKAIRLYGYANVYCFMRSEDCLAFMNLQPDIVFLDDLDILRKIKSMDPEVITYFIKDPIPEDRIRYYLNETTLFLKSSILQQSVA
jgi:hypothetical protein